MSFDPITAGINFFSQIIEKIWPNKSEIEKQQLAAQMAQAVQEFEITKAQIEVNKTEAANPNLFVSGWRPFCGWSCGLGLFFILLAKPILISLLSISILFGVNASLVDVVIHQLPNIDTDLVMALIVPLLGLGAFRSYEKIKLK